MGFITDKQKGKVTFCKRSKLLLKSLSFLYCAHASFLVVCCSTDIEYAFYQLKIDREK